MTEPQVLDKGQNQQRGRARLVTLLLLALAVSGAVVVGLRIGTNGHDSRVPQEVDDAGVRPTVPSPQGPVAPPSESSTTVPAPPSTRYSGNSVQVAAISTPNTTLLPVVVLDSPTGNGVVLGRLVISDSESDQISYSVTSAPSGGMVEMHADGSFTYTPSSATRHVAAARNDSTRDTFIITVDDGHGRISSVPVSVPILPLNAAPTATTSVGAPNNYTGMVAGSVSGTDPDGDPLTYSVVTTAARGSVVVNADGSFTYTPTSQARHAAAAPGGVTTDSFTISVDDGYGGSTSVPVSAPIDPSNAAPSATTSIGAPNNYTGMVAGSVSGTDPDGDPLTYSVATTAARGSVIVNADGSFTYTPTNAARQAAAAPGGVTTDSFTISVDDGYGGSTSVPVSVPIAP